MPRRHRYRRTSPSRGGCRSNGWANRLKGFEPLEQRIALSATPFGAQPRDTAEFLLGSVDVSVVLMESSDDPRDVDFVRNDNSETWTASSINAVKAKVTEGLNWWIDTLAGITDKHTLNFNVDFAHADDPVITTYEPITRPSSDYQFWVREFLDHAGVQSTGSVLTDMRSFNHQQREAEPNPSNWAFTIFVVNDQNDPDHEFASGGLPRAFAFPGGLFLVTLASRPASTITHEMGHIFWALDEYQGGGRYETNRGYYDTKNANAWDNPIFSSGQQREPSIMDRGACEEGGGLLCDAYVQHTSSQSSLEMVGWRDSDGDGIFDVLDVEHTLEGTGYYESATGLYHFVGESSVQTLPNLNPRISSLPTESLQSDITINRISRAEYRIDGSGPWLAAATPDTYVATLDLSFPVPATASQVEIRTIDAVTGVTSPVFVADLTRPASTSLSAGVSGFVFRDADTDGQFETGESGLAGRTVRLVDASGQPISLQKGLEPDDYPSNADISDAIPGATLIALGTGTSGTTVYARSVGQGSTGSQVFGACSFGSNACSIYQTEWTSRTRQLRIEFTSPVTTVSIDALSNNAEDYGRLEIYDDEDNRLARYTTAALASGQFETMTLSRPTADIAYAIVGGHADQAVRLDNLRFGPLASSVTDALGAFSLPSLEAGSYRVHVDGPAGLQATTATTQSVTLSAGLPTATVDFGFEAFVSSWQNSTNRFDVNNDGAVSPLDALVVINDLNSKGARKLGVSDAAPPFLDVNGDGHVAPIDVLQVINKIEDSHSEGEASGLASATTVIVSSGPAVAEGEFVPAVAPHEELPLARRSFRSESFQPVEAARSTLPFGASIPRSARAEPERDFRAVELAVVDDLLDGPTLEAVIDELAGDVALLWDAARVSG